jgi:hypothetical protein
VRKLAITKSPHQTRPGEPNPAELFGAPYGARAPHGWFAALARAVAFRATPTLRER